MVKNQRRLYQRPACPATAKKAPAPTTVSRGRNIKTRLVHVAIVQAPFISRPRLAYSIWWRQLVLPGMRGGPHFRSAASRLQAAFFCGFFNAEKNNHRNGQKGPGVAEDGMLCGAVQDDPSQTCDQAVASRRSPAVPPGVFFETAGPQVDRVFAASCRPKVPMQRGTPTCAGPSDPTSHT